MLACPWWAGRAAPRRAERDDLRASATGVLLALSPYQDLAANIGYPPATAKPC